MALPGPYTPTTQWKATSSIGSPGDPGRIAVDEIGTVREVVTAGSGGGGDNSVDVAVLEFGTAPNAHAAAFTEAQLTAWFTAA